MFEAVKKEGGAKMIMVATLHGVIRIVVFTFHFLTNGGLADSRPLPRPFVESRARH